MTREEIANTLMARVPRCRCSVCTVDFAVEQVNKALDEAADAIDGMGKAEHADAEYIRNKLKIKE
jgi:hypothetical protein